MRTFAASFVLTRVSDGDAPSAVLGSVLDAWHQERFDDPKLADRDLQRKESDERHEERRLHRWDFSERVASGDGRWTTVVRLLEDDAVPDAAYVSIEMAWEDMADRLAPLHVPVGPPRFLSRLHGRCDVKSIDGNAATPKALEVRDAEQFRLLIGEILDPGRKLPLVVVSDPVYQPAPVDDLPEKLARRVYGLGRVVHLSPRMARSLVLQVGRELAVFDGAIRIYWPGAATSDPPRKHPLLLRATMARWGTARAIEQEVLGRIAGQLIKAATQRYRPPAAIDAFERYLEQKRISDAAESLEQLRAELAAARSEMAAARDMEAVALADNRDKQRELEGLEQELSAAKEDLHREREKNAALRLALQQAGRVVVSPPPEPSTAEEAVEAARASLSDLLVIPSDIVVETDLGADVYDVLKAMSAACEAERLGKPRNRELFQAVLDEYFEHPGKYKPGPTGTYYVIDGRKVEVRDRVHLRSTRPVETESVYFIPVGEQPSRKYLITRVGRHA